MMPDKLFTKFGVNYAVPHILYGTAWKENNNSRSSQITPFYSSQDIRINDVFRPDNVIKTVEVTLIHNWHQEVKESQLTDYKVQ